ncbi:MAG: SLC13 family permease [Bacteroidetes bacterium]|nr:SLC13 family permease [Bacteroidota bacterium]MCW5895919.1 SLC13 family permease [Bacteroidota bacterium]
MTVEMIVVLAVVLLAVVLFATERFPVDQVALTIMAILLLSGIITPQEGIAGFSNTATVTVGAMFVLSAGLFRTGVVNYLGALVVRLFKFNLWVALLATMVVVGGLSAFVNNTPIVAIFLPIMLGASRDIGTPASKLLMPLSFASMFGGVCTLIGTSTNILISSIAVRYDQAPFGMFEFSALGLIFFAAGTIYMMVIGIRLIPTRESDTMLTDKFGLGEYITEVILQPEAKSVGTQLNNCPLVEELGVQVLDVFRDGKRLHVSPASTTLAAGDLLRVVGDVKKIKALQERVGITIKPSMKFTDADLESEDMLLVEAIVAPISNLAGKSLKQSQFRSRFNATVLAIRHRGTLMRENLGDTRLRSGDSLLLEIAKDQIDAFRASNEFVFVSEVGLPKFRRRKVIPALLIVAGVVSGAALGLVDIVAAAIAGSVLLVLFRCITMEEAYRAIDWKVIFLLAGTLSLGLALEKTGAAALLSTQLIALVGDLGPVALVAVFYLLTSLLTETMSNNATAVLLAPIAIGSAQAMGVDARPLLMAVAFAASASFMTPVGYQTNTMIYGVGRYRFADFLKVGAPLNLIFWILATLLIPVFWPF